MTRQSDSVTPKIVVKCKLEKFDGEKVEGDGKKPVEVIEFEEELTLEQYQAFIGGHYNGTG